MPWTPGALCAPWWGVDLRLTPTKPTARVSPSCRPALQPYRFIGSNWRVAWWKVFFLHRCITLCHTQVPKGRPHSLIAMHLSRLSHLHLWPFEKMCAPSWSNFIIYVICGASVGSDCNPSSSSNSCLCRSILDLPSESHIEQLLLKLRFLSHESASIHQGQVKPNCRTVCLWHPEAQTCHPSFPACDPISVCARKSTFASLYGRFGSARNASYVCPIQTREVSIHRSH